jgi:hypothetical protein
LFEKELRLKECERRLNDTYIDNERQHQLQIQHLEDMYEKERFALNKLVSSTEKENSRLLSELSSVKLSLAERLARAVSGAGDVMKQLKEVVSSSLLFDHLKFKYI